MNKGGFREKVYKAWSGSPLSLAQPLLLLTYAGLLPAAGLIQDHKLIDAAGMRDHQDPHVEIVIH